MAIDIINNIRVAEDLIGFVFMAIIMVYLTHTAIKARKMNISYMPTALIIGFLPLFLWKAMGGIKRAFIDKATSPELYNFLNESGEIMESLSGLILGIAIFFILRKLSTESSDSSSKKKK